MVEAAKKKLALALGVVAVAGMTAAAVQTARLVGERPGEAGPDRRRAARVARLERGLGAQSRLDPAQLSALATTNERHLVFDALADCVTTARVGRRGDGAKWICNPYKIHQPCVVYGVGAGSEITFDNAMAASFGCEVHVFDPSPEAVQKFGSLSAGTKVGQGSITFHPWGLGPVSSDPAKARTLVVDGKECEVKTLDEIVAALGHRKIDILKIDIEGGELYVLPYLLEHDLLRKYGVDQLLVEFHTFVGEDYKAFVTVHAALTAAKYVLFRKELNPNFAGTCAEYAYADVSYLID